MNATHSPKSILLIRTSAMGDVIIATSLISALKASYPEARIDWLVDARYQELLQDHPGLAHVIAWPRGRWQTLLRHGQYRQWVLEIKTFLAELRRQPYDWVIDTQGLLKSGLWAFLSRAKWRIGYGSREGTQYLMHRVVPRPGERVRRDWPRYSIGDEYRPLRQALGLPEQLPELHVTVQSDPRNHVQDLIKARIGSQPYVAICPFTTRPQKHWLSERWSELADALSQQSGMPVILLGGPQDRAEADRITARASAIINLCGETGLPEAAAILQSAKLVIGVDTGLTHLAVATKAPTLALFGSTCPYLDTGSTRGKVLYQFLDCSPCGRHPTCQGKFTCMERHGVAQVLHASAELLVAPPPPVTPGT